MEKSNYQFHGYWIKGTEIDYGQEDNEYYLKQPNPLMKKEFVVNEINSSYIYIGILGYAIVDVELVRVSLIVIGQILKSVSIMMFMM